MQFSYNISKENVWDFHCFELEFPDESLLKKEPNFSSTKVKLSIQNTNFQITSEKPLNGTNITQNNIIFINNVENSRANEKTNIIINNIFQERESISINKNNYKNDNENSFLENNPLKNEVQSHKSSLKIKERTPSPKKSNKRVSFSNQIQVYNHLARNENSISHFSKKQKKTTTCKSCGLF